MTINQDKIFSIYFGSYEDSEEIKLLLNDEQSKETITRDIQDILKTMYLARKLIVDRFNLKQKNKLKAKGIFGVDFMPWDYEAKQFGMSERAYRVRRGHYHNRSVMKQIMNTVHHDYTKNLYKEDKKSFVTALKSYSSKSPFTMGFQSFGGLEDFEESKSRVELIKEAIIAKGYALLEEQKENRICLPLWGSFTDTHINPMNSKPIPFSDYFQN